MKKFIAIEEEVLVRLLEGKYVEGSLHRDKWTGVITFNAWVRKSPKHPKDRVICQLENGWLKESAERIKFFNSVKKELGLVVERILSDKIAKDITEESLAKLVVAAMNGEDPSKYQVEVNSANAALKSALAKQIEKGLEIHPVKGVSMRLSCKDGSGYYDFSDEEIAALLKPFLGEMKI